MVCGCWNKNSNIDYNSFPITDTNNYYAGWNLYPDYCVLKFTAEGGRYYCDLKTESFAIE